MAAYHPHRLPDHSAVSVPTDDERDADDNDDDVYSSRPAPSHPSLPE